LHKIKVTLPSGSDDENQKQQPWQAIYENYDQHMVVADYEDCTKIEDRLRQQQDQKSRPILVPSYIEIGKGEGEQYRPHFKINNKRLNFKR
jgi:transketolase